MRVDVNQGRCGSVWRVKIHPAHLKAVSPYVEAMVIEYVLKFSSKTERENEHFALRTVEYYSKPDELDALRRAVNIEHDHLVKLVASFDRGDHFFLFPWAEQGDLNNVWWNQMQTDARTPKFVRWAFEQMAGLAAGLAKLNDPAENLEEREDDHHGDLNPLSIFLFKDKSNTSFGTLRIAYAGIARYHLLRDPAYTERHWGRRKDQNLRYAPPESRFLEKDDIKLPGFDMWSLGCTYLEFIIWILGGTTELRKFGMASGAKFWQEVFEIFYSGEHRHLGYDVCDSVERAIKLLRRDKRCHRHTCFRDLLEIIEKHLLVIESRKRMRSSELCDRFNRILQEGTKRPGYWGGVQESGFEPRSIF